MNKLNPILVYRTRHLPKMQIFDVCVNCLRRTIDNDYLTICRNHQSEIFDGWSFNCMLVKTVERAGCREAYSIKWRCLEVNIKLPKAVKPTSKRYGPQPSRNARRVW